LANSIIPNPMERRHLIEKDLDAARCTALAEAYLEVGRASDAVVFFAKAGAHDRLIAMAETAVADGDAFLLGELVDASSEVTATPERWRKLADTAEAVGLLRYAEMARRHARSGDDEAG
jgi:putative heme degradation protein